jgi:hypothetical protein
MSTGNCFAVASESTTWTSSSAVVAIASASASMSAFSLHHPHENCVKRVFFEAYISLDPLLILGKMVAKYLCRQTTYPAHHPKSTFIL